MQMSGKRVYLETLGCQMNVLDSELVLGQLRALGYEPTEKMSAADVVLINTCSVRQHAEDKALSRLGQLKKTKRERPDLVVGVIGCMAERDAEGIFEKAPHVDLLCGPGELNKVPALIEEVQRRRVQGSATRGQGSAPRVADPAVGAVSDGDARTVGSVSDRDQLPPTQYSVLSTQHSVLGTQDSGLRTQHSTRRSRSETAPTQDSGLRTQDSTLRTQDSPLRVVALAESLSRRSSVLERALEFDSMEALDLSRSPGPDANTLQAYIRVQRGCDKFCTFCVVPFTRGPERSRPAGNIVHEARMLVDHGAREITLLGQTVNSYTSQEDGRPVRFADLLEQLNDVDGLDRIRFVTSYPGDFTDDILDAMRELPKVCEYLHIPAQSGSDAVLKRMRRQYSSSQYFELIDRAKEKVPGLTLASDFIVGFCGETDDDFARTVAMVERCRFKNIFVFKYSPRPGTVADKRDDDDVPESVKRTRNVELLKVQERISQAANREMVGRTFEVLVEGYSKAAIKAQEAEQSRGAEVSHRFSQQLVGRTRGDQIVVFDGRPQLIGALVYVNIVGATPLTLLGEVSGLVSAARARSSLPLAVVAG